MNPFREIDRLPFAAMLTLLLTGVAIGWYLKPSIARVPSVPGEVRIERTIDTVVREVLRSPLLVRRSAAHVTTHGPLVVAWSPGDSAGGSLDRDTLRAQPFTASIDTVAGGDTVHAEFTFPPPAISLAIRSAPDSVIERNIETIRTVTVSDPWYQEAGKYALGAAVGAVAVYFLGPR